jgi:hypothetical protein
VILVTAILSLDEWWSNGVVEWWSGGVVEWWSGGVVEWWTFLSSFEGQTLLKTLLELVEHHRKDNNKTGDHLLPEFLDT